MRAPSRRRAVTPGARVGPDDRYGLLRVTRWAVVPGWPVATFSARLVRERHARHCRGAGQWTFAAGVEAHRRANSGRSVSFAGALALFLGALVLYAAAKIIVEVLIAWARDHVMPTSSLSAAA